MTIDFEARSQDFLARCFPHHASALEARVAPHWEQVRNDPAFAQAQAFLRALPTSGWQYDEHDHAPTWTHAQVPELPSAAVQALQALIPWRKGPLNFAGTHIDAEWRSELKWQRILPLLPPLEGQHVIDVGSNNGYYGHRLLFHGAASVLGLDPQKIYVSQALCAEGLTPERPIATLPVGLEVLDALPRSASLILLMGILYHHSDPLSVLRLAADALAPKGRLLVETIIIEGEDSTALFVPQRYTGAKGFYWLPTRRCLNAWIQKANLRVLTELEPVPTDRVEQRTTAWRSGDSLHEGLDPNDLSRTIEGHPAPQRVALLCARG